MLSYVRPSAYSLRHESAVYCISHLRYDVVKAPTSSEEGWDVWVMLDCLAAGDYIGAGTIGRSNVRVFEEEFSALFEAETAVIVRGDHGYRAIAIRWEAYDHHARSSDCIASDEEVLSAEECTRLELWDALARTLAGLADYPIMSEDDHSMLECEEEQEAWTSYGRRDFQRALQKAFPDLSDALDEASNDALDSLWTEGTEAAGWYTEHTSEGPYFPIDRVVSRGIDETMVAAAVVVSE